MAEYAKAASPIVMVGTYARAECRQCGGHEDWRVHNRPPPEIVKKHFATRGWDLRKGAICAQCAEKNSRKDKSNMATKTQPKLEVVPSKDAKAARLEALDWLREGFNRETGRFSAGVSDATIAQETGLAVAAVAALREEWFGALREPSEIEALRTELEAAQSQIATIVQRLDGLCKANGWAA